jgi:hypothetical protein
MPVGVASRMSSELGRRDRPLHIEPRLKKRRAKNFAYTRRPRDEIKRDTAKGLIEVPFASGPEAGWKQPIGYPGHAHGGHLSALLGASRCIDRFNCRNWERKRSLAVSNQRRRITSLSLSPSSRQTNGGRPLASPRLTLDLV